MCLCAACAPVCVRARVRVRAVKELQDWRALCEHSGNINLSSQQSPSDTSVNVFGADVSSVAVQELPQVGVRVEHPQRGLGTVVEMLVDDSRKKPCKVAFDNGEVHQYSKESAAKLRCLADEAAAPKSPASKMRIFAKVRIYTYKHAP